jgi:hypothetical protein
MLIKGSGENRNNKMGLQVYEYATANEARTKFKETETALACTGSIRLASLDEMRYEFRCLLTYVHHYETNIASPNVFRNAIQNYMTMTCYYLNKIRDTTL